MRSHLGLMLAAGLMFGLSTAKGANIFSTTNTGTLTCEATGGAAGVAANGVVEGRQWTQTVGYTNVSISVALSMAHAGPSDVTVYLTTQVGPGTTTAQQIATATVTVPDVFEDTTLTTVFSGLTLPPGTYYLTVFGDPNQAAPPLGSTCITLASTSTTTTGTGVTVNGDIENGTSVATYPPATGFGSLGSQRFLMAASADLIAPPTITKSFGLSQIPVGGSTSMTITITNPSTNTVSLSGIGFTDTLPAGLTTNSITGNTCVGGSIGISGGPPAAVTLSGITLAGGASCSVTATVNAIAAGLQTNSVTVTSTTAGNGNTATASVLVVSPPTISKAFGAPSVALNGNTTLTFTLMNLNAGAALTGVSFSDPFPSGLVVATTPGVSNSCGGTVTATAGASLVSLSGGGIAASGTCTISLNVTGSTGGVKNNTTGAISSNQGGTGSSSNTATLTVNSPPTISKAFGVASVALNGSTNLTFTITNPNAGALTGVSFSDSFPSGLVVATTPGVSNSCGGTVTATAGASSVSLSGGGVAASGSCTISVNVTGSTAGVKNNTTGAISSNEGGTGTTSNTATLTVVDPPSITKLFSSATVPLGGTATLSFTVSNPNTTVAVSGIALTDSIPSGLVVSTPNGLTGTCGGGTITATAGASTVSLAGATLAASASCTFSVSVTGITAGVENNSVTITSTSAGTGNTSNASITVVAPPSITKTFGATTIPLLGSTTLNFLVSNPNTTVALTGVNFTDTLPAGLDVSTPNGLTGSCGGGTITAVAGSTSVSLTGATIAASGSCTFSVNVTGLAGGTQSNSVTVSSTNGGTGNTSTANLTVLVPAVFYGYAANLGSGDSFVDISNDGALGGSTTQSGTTASVPGSICANVFAFDPGEELVSCCSCPVTPNGLVSISALQDLVNNPLTHAAPNSISITIVATQPVAGSCANSAATVNTAALAPGLAAWSTTLHSNTSTKGFSSTENPFTLGSSNMAELARLAQVCTFAQQQGTGSGICTSCVPSGQ